MSEERPTITYYYRGMVEKVGSMGRGRWAPGYSEQGANGPLYPWLTRRECQHEAKHRGAKAVFVEGGLR